MLLSEPLLHMYKKATLQRNLLFTGTIKLLSRRIIEHFIKYIPISRQLFMLSGGQCKEDCIRTNTNSGVLTEIF